MLAALPILFFFDTGVDYCTLRSLCWSSAPWSSIFVRMAFFMRVCGIISVLRRSLLSVVVAFFMYLRDAMSAVRLGWLCVVVALDLCDYLLRRGHLRALAHQLLAWPFWPFSCT